MFSENAGGGDQRCASLRSTVELALAGFSVWSVGNLYEPYPTSCMWGYYRSEVSDVFGTPLDRSFTSRLHRWRDALTRGNTYRAIQTYTHFSLDSAGQWQRLRACFHERFLDLPHPLRAPPDNDSAEGAGEGFSNVLLWDLAFLLFTPGTSSNSTAGTIMPTLWKKLARYADPNGPSTYVVPRADATQASAWDKEYEGGREQRLMLLHAADREHVWACALTPYVSIQSFSGCKVSASSSEALYLQMNFTGVPPRRKQAAVALMNWVLRGGRVVNASDGSGDDDRAVLNAGRPPTRYAEGYLDLQRAVHVCVQLTSPTF